MKMLGRVFSILLVLVATQTTFAFEQSSEAADWHDLFARPSALFTVHMHETKERINSAFCGQEWLDDAHALLSDLTLSFDNEVNKKLGIETKSEAKPYSAILAQLKSMRTSQCMNHFFQKAWPASLDIFNALNPQTDNRQLVGESLNGATVSLSLRVLENIPSYGLIYLQNGQFYPENPETHEIPGLVQGAPHCEMAVYVKPLNFPKLTVEDYITVRSGDPEGFAFIIMPFHSQDIDNVTCYESSRQTYSDSSVFYLHVLQYLMLKNGMALNLN